MSDGARIITPAVEAILAGQHVPYVLFVYLATDNPVRLTNAPWTIGWDGHDWSGAGMLGSINPIEEGDELQMYGVSMALSGIPPEYVQMAIGSHYQGRDCMIWLAPFTEAGQLAADPVLAFAGRLDVMTVELGDTATISVSAESRLTDWARPRTSRFTDADQQSRYPGDKGLEFVAKVAELEIVWGRT